MSGCDSFLFSFHMCQRRQSNRCLCKEISASSLFVSAASSSIDLDIDLQIAVQHVAHFNGLEVAKFRKNEQRCAKI